MMRNLARKRQHTNLILSLITPTIWMLPLPAALVHQSGFGARLERDRGRPAAESPHAVQAQRTAPSQNPSWRRLHLAVDPDSSEILAVELTTTDEGDASLVGPLLDQIDDPVSAVLRMERMMAILPIGPSSTVIRTPRWSSDPDQMRF